MMIVMKEGATEEQIAHVVERIEEVGCSAHLSRGELLTVIGAIGDRDRVAALGLEGSPGVDHLVPILKPYKLASAQFKKGERTVVEVDGRRIGGEHFGLIAGPCTVESREQTLEVARVVADAGATMLRGGAYKPRTSPYSFQGLGVEGLRLLQEAKEETGLPIVTELMDVRDTEDVVEVADVIQIGARNMQNYNLLTEVGRTATPVLLKRGLSSTLDDLLMASEYVLKEGNPNVILCERGIRTFETAYRFTLDLLAIPALRELTHLPIVIDPSHAPGRRDWVPSMSMAAAAAGADGIIVEVHNDPEHAICDGPQALPTDRASPSTPSRCGAVAEVAGKLVSVSSVVKIAVLGVGLIGGSIGLAARRRAGTEVAGSTRSRRTSSAGSSSGRSTAPPARSPRRSTAPRSSSAPRRSPRSRDSSPRRWRRAATETVVSDVGSTKRELIEGLGDAEGSDRFIGGHPLAGAETAGVENARAELLEGARWYLTPTERSSGVHYDLLQGTVSDLGARPQAIDPATHDRVMATGQPPAARARQRARQRGGGGALRGVRAAARGRDELSRHDPGRRRQPGDLGGHLRQQPRGGRRGLDSVGERLREAAALIRSGDREAVGGWHAAAGDDRRRLLEADLAGGDLRELRIGVENRPGTVAEIALALGHAQVNIEDMALYPAPDMRTGAISVWVAGVDEAERAAEVVRGLGHVAAIVPGGDPDDPLRPRAAAARRRSPRRRTSRSPTGRRSSPRWARGETVVRDYLDAADTRSTLAAVRAVGRHGRAGDRRRELRIRGVGLRGAAAGGDRRRQRRDAAAAAAGVARGPARGRVELRRRRVDPPAARSTAWSSRCAEMGAEIEAREDRLVPMAVRGAALRGIEYRLPVASAQVKSCLLLAGLVAEGETSVIERRPTRDHTERMLRAAGATVRTRERRHPGDRPRRAARAAGRRSSPRRGWSPARSPSRPTSPRRRSSSSPRARSAAARCGSRASASTPAGSACSGS